MYLGGEGLTVREYLSLGRKGPGSQNASQAGGKKKKFLEKQKKKTSKSKQPIKEAEIVTG